MSRPTKTKWIRVRINNHLADRIEAEAQEYGMNRSEYVRFILSSWVFTSPSRLVDKREEYRA